jgi:hypothetical protein
VKASSGPLGLGAYPGYLELQYPATLPANTASYVRIETDDNLLSSLLGGSLGRMLADVAKKIALSIFAPSLLRSKKTSSSLFTL